MIKKYLLSLKKNTLTNNNLIWCFRRLQKMCYLQKFTTIRARVSLFHSSSHSSIRHRQRPPSFDTIIYIIIYLPTAVRFSCFKFSDHQ